MQDGYSAAGRSDIMPKALIETYGCTLNQADSDIIESILRQNGVDVARGEYGSNTDYDVVVVNTCTVKKATEQRIRDRLRGMSHLGKRLIVTGCMASANRDIIEKTVGSASIISTNNITNVYEAVKGSMDGNKVVYDSKNRTDKAAYVRPSGSVIARIPISEGCLSSCNFCETKFARGPLNSFSEELILKAVEMNVRGGAREIELASQDTGAYGADRRTDIAWLVSRISELEGEFMVRIGMLNPEHLHKYFDRLVEAYKSEKAYKFIHLPVQSGSNKVLGEMSRNYRIEEFEGYVDELRRKIPGITVETDIIVGYPTETDQDFEETLGMMERVKPTITNISKFGARPHASASKLAQLSGNRINERSRRLARMVKAMQHEEFSKFKGKKIKVLLTERNESSVAGRNISYLAVAVKNCGTKLGESISVEISGNSYACLIGSQSKDLNIIKWKE